MSLQFSYRHLYYFWVVAKEGGMSRAAERLDMAVQTVSAQVRELERALGVTLLKPAGRGLTLTEAGLAAMRQADQIFQLGEQLPAIVRDATSGPSVRLAVGVADGVPKLVVWHLLQPVMAEPQLRLMAQEDEFDDLLGQLALHRLDVVLADRPAPPNPNLKLYSHPIGRSPLSWYATDALAERARRGFPQSLSEVPVVLPSNHVAVRARIDQWFENQGVRPLIVGEFEDSALLATFASKGMGVFPLASLVEKELATDYRVHPVGACRGVEDHYYAIGTERRIIHPLVQRLLPAS